MSTVVKALSLLDHLEARRPEIGLVDLARLANLDEATTRRLLIALAAKGFIEQDPATRRYRLGAALVRLARIRDAAFPFIEIARPIVGALAQRTGETVHISQFAGDTLSSVFVCESPHANRVSVDVGQTLPFNCTASGLAFLSAASETFQNQVLNSPLPHMTPKSIATAEALRKGTEETRKLDYAMSDQGFEIGVVSIAAAIVGPSGAAVGALSITSPPVRADAATLKQQGRDACDVAARISAALGGRLAAL
ncbi:MAG TPA: IclR family transcriptional regulator [Roseiarcus sp.]|nr:IclR family transcriptional regulator [Roseiarcus sp.]